MGPLGHTTLPCGCLGWVDGGRDGRLDFGIGIWPHAGLILSHGDVPSLRLGIRTVPCGYCRLCQVVMYLDNLGRTSLILRLGIFVNKKSKRL